WPAVDTLPDLPYEVLSSDCFAFDVVYNPEQTAFLRRCAAQGAKIRNGLEMLHIQAEEAWKIWTA
ncbi:MAG: shikimate dehydrogenase, partial [Bacteroidales bacterium]|nr:shikimate dehydrogenase [Bacteroidales bacterium]